MIKNITQWASVVLLSFATQVSAQGLQIDIAEGSASALPIAVVPFAFESSSLPPDTDLAAVIAGDFNRCGQFRSLPRQDVVEFPAREADVKFATWKQLRQDFLLVGRILDGDAGNYRIEFELFDVNKQQNLMRLAIGAKPSDLRSAAHQIADLVYEKILGVRGAFWTRMAYITATGLGNNMQYKLMVADSDGFNPREVVRSAEPLLSPAWSPDGRRLAYVSFERGNSSIYIQELNTGSRQIISAFKGINGAPAFSPDGTKLALTLSMATNPEIYVMDLATRATTQLTRHFAIDTEAIWSADGQSIYFTSDRAGKPQIYMVPASGGDAVRQTFQGEYNAKASITSDGKRLAMVQGGGNVYRIAVLDRRLGTPGEVQVLSPGNLDESPSFAPNGSMLLYASREGKRGVLFAVSADGRVRQKLVLADGDVREPAWSPFRQR